MPYCCRYDARFVATLVNLLAVGIGACAAAAAPPAPALADFDKPADAEVMEAEVARTTDALARAPRDARLYFARGAAHFKLRDFAQAVADFSAAIKLDDRLDDAYFGRGMALARNGDIDAGIADLSVYIKRNPNSSLAHTKRGVRHLWNGELDLAERDLKRAIALDANNAEAHDDLGVILAQREDYARAAEHFRTTIKLEPRYQKAYHNLAFVYYLMDQEPQALKAVDAALALGEDRDSLLLKAVILEALGRAREAKAIKEQAEFLPEGNWSERAPIQ